MSASYLLLARYQAIAGKNKYILLPFGGSLESFSNTDGELVIINLLPIESNAVIECEGNGDLTLLAILMLSGDGELKSYTEETITLVQVLPMNVGTLIKSYTEENITLLKVLPMQVDTLIDSYTEETITLLKVAHLKESDVLIKLRNSNADLHTPLLFTIPADDVETRTYTDATGYSYRLMYINTSGLEIKSYLDSNIRPIPVLKMDGGMESEHYGIADMIPLPVVRLDSTSSEYTELLSTIRCFMAELMSGSLVNHTETETGVKVFDAKICGSEEEVNAEAIANMRIWALPAVKGNTLLIRQVADAIKTGNTLEVI